jgi:hypothetical protein
MPAESRWHLNMQMLSDKNKPSLRSGEDPGSVWAVEVPLQFQQHSIVPPPSVGAICSLHFCDFSEQLVCGHTDGKASIWHVTDDASAPQLRAVLGAHRNGRTAATVTTQWGGLWTSSSSGSVRLWPQAMSDARSAREGPEGLASWQGREVRRGEAERAQGHIIGLRLCAAGQVCRWRPPF